MIKILMPTLIRYFNSLNTSNSRNCFSISQGHISGLGKDNRIIDTPIFEQEVVGVVLNCPYWHAPYSGNNVKYKVGN